VIPSKSSTISDSRERCSPDSSAIACCKLRGGIIDILVLPIPHANKLVILRTLPVTLGCKKAQQIKVLIPGRAEIGCVCAPLLGKCLEHERFTAVVPADQDRIFGIANM
jgi:hypothetical protein